MITVIAAYICQQKVISKKENLDLGKTARTSCVGFSAIAPLVYSWLRLAEFVCPGRAVMSIVKKVVSEQLLFAPVALTTFYTASSFLEGKKDIFAEAKAKFLPTYKTGLTYWPIVQTINFAFVPTDKKVYLLATASFLWTNYLCYMKEKKVEQLYGFSTARSEIGE
ncbi:mpv17-like protein isoform X2 [Liolophura sinensis]|uniref:mpv17-like protein isoform X2 n=1 Tax=Liolophura sinensis TaxID=3198878 RepID=UPI003158D8E3